LGPDAEAGERNLNSVDVKGESAGTTAKSQAAAANDKKGGRPKTPRKNSQAADIKLSSDFVRSLKESQK